MSQTSSLKRRLLRQAVAENLSVRKGEPAPWRPAVRIVSEKKPSRWRLAWLALPPLVLVVSLQALRREPPPDALPPEPGLAPAMLRRHVLSSGGDAHKISRLAQAGDQSEHNRHGHVDGPQIAENAEAGQHTAPQHHEAAASGVAQRGH